MATLFGPRCILVGSKTVLTLERRHTFVDVVIAGVGSVQADGDVWVSKSSVCQLHHLVVATRVRRRAGHSLLRHHLYDAIHWRRQGGPRGPSPPPIAGQKFFLLKQWDFQASLQLNPVVHVTITQREGGISIRCPTCILVQPISLKF